MQLNIKKKTIIIDAPVTRRVIAFLIDFIILNAFVLFPFNKVRDKIFAASSISQGMSMISDLIAHPEALRPMLWLSVLMGVVIMLYFMVLEAKYNQSIGKMLMNIFVINDEKGKQISYMQSMLRSASLIVDVVFIIDIVYAAFNSGKQRLFERLSKTRTIAITQI